MGNHSLEQSLAVAVWTLTKDGGTLRWELRDRGDLGCQSQLLRDGQISSGRLFPDRAVALAEAERARAFFEARGWTPCP
jgi:hypothetical protein